MKFFILPRGAQSPDCGINSAYLRADGWDDFSYKTSFYLSLHDEFGTYHEIGNVKVGFKGQEIIEHTSSSLDYELPELPDGYFSLGQDVEYYQRLSKLSVPLRDDLLVNLKDLVLSSELLEKYREEYVLSTSLLRYVSLTAIKGMFSRTLQGLAPLTNFEFKFSKPATDKISGIDLDFKVLVDSKPSTNIHAIIGRNGVGKTTLLNGMIKAITSKEQSDAKFYDLEDVNSFIEEKPIENDYFSSLTSVSFSAFDPFEPPKEQPNPSLGTCYFYIGLKKEGEKLKDLNDIHEDFLTALTLCF